MRFFPASALANDRSLVSVRGCGRRKVLGWVLGFFLCGRANALVRAGEVPTFSVDPSPVLAGRTLVVDCRTKAPVTEAWMEVDSRRVWFYKMRRHLWRARLGIGATEPAGPRTKPVFLVVGTETVRCEVHFEVSQGRYPVSHIRLSPARDALFTNGTVERDGDRLASVYGEANGFKKLWQGAFVFPSTGVVSSVFGARRSYGARPASGSHSGVDVANRVGTPVVAPARGRVVCSEWMDSFGFVVMLDHGQGVYSYFLHLRSAGVRVGQRVHLGDFLGEMGQEGVATGPHVHWSLVVGGVRVDPVEWVERVVP